MKNKEIKIKNSSSSLSEFVKRPLPSDDEVEAFDQYVADEIKEEEVKKSLANIYQDDKGNRVDVKTLTIKKRRGFLFNLVTFVIVIFVLASAGYAAYNFYLKINASKQPVSLSFDANKEVAAGEEFSYILNYKNEDRVGINNIEIKVKYPDNFIFTAGDPRPTSNNDTWDIASLASHRSNQIKITGRLIGPVDASNIMLADMTYTPENFSSEFKKSAATEIKVNDLGLDLSFVNSSSAMVNEENQIVIKFKAKEQNFLNNFRLTLDHPEEVIVTNQPVGQATSSAPQIPLIKSTGPDSWLVSDLGKNDDEFTIKFKVKEKKQPSLNLKIKFDWPLIASGTPDKYFTFFEKDLTYEIIKSDLNINIIANGSALDQGIDFGQTINYSINFANKGSTPMKDIIIMAVLESDFLDWSSLKDEHNGVTNLPTGQAGGNTISWSKNEITALAELASGATGVLDFSLKLKPLSTIDPNKAYQVKSYVNYSLNGQSVAGENQSNTIINKINSNLNLTEQLRYFSNDNIAVGFGPLPPKVGQTTSLKIYWTINNSLHELNNLTISVNLPAGVGWDGKNNSSIGTVSFDAQNNKVVWQIGTLPITLDKATAEFNVSVTPKETDRNKIILILPGTNVSALDSQTGTQISNTLKAKTSKLDDDNIANTDGIVQ
jgi:hypothetical protein